MKFSSDRGIQTGRWLPNELLRDEDINFVGYASYINSTNLLATLVGTDVDETKDYVIGGLEITHSTLLTMTLNAGIAVSFSGYYLLNDGTWAFSASAGEPFSVYVGDNQSIAVSSGGTQDRIDIIEVRPIINDFDSKLRQFKNPSTGVVGPSPTNTKTSYEYEFAVREGTEAASPVANTKTAGWIKLAEVYVAASASSITQNDIKGVSYSDEWTSERRQTIRTLQASSRRSARTSVSLWGSSPTTALDFTSVAWSPKLDLFAAVATNGVATSANGVNWTQRSGSASATWRGIAWSPSLELFAAVADTGAAHVMTSPDGINWTSRTAASSNGWQDIVWADGLGLFVAVATSGTNTRVMTSPDGITWTTRTSSSDDAWTGITWSKELGLLVAVSSAPSAMTSPDGINWTTRTIPGTTNIQKVAWGGRPGIFVAVGDTGDYVVVSADGITWEAATLPVLDTYWRIIWAPELELFVATNDGGPYLHYSHNGRDWTSIETIGAHPTDVECLGYSPKLQRIVGLILSNAYFTA